MAEAKAETEKSGEHKEESAMDAAKAEAEAVNTNRKVQWLKQPEHRGTCIRQSLIIDSTKSVWCGS